MWWGKTCTLQSKDKRKKVSFQPPWFEGCQRAAVGGERRQWFPDRWRCASEGKLRELSPARVNAQLNLGGRLTGDRSYPPWNQPPTARRYWYRVVCSRQQAYIYFKYISHIILIKVRSKTLSTVWQKSFLTFFGDSENSSFCYAMGTISALEALRDTTTTTSWRKTKAAAENRAEDGKEWPMFHSLRVTWFIKSL